MTLHPFFQIQVGDIDFTATPDFIQSVTYKSSIEALSTMDFTLIDPTYSTIEQLLIRSDVNNEPILSRFGYADRAGNVASNWFQSRLINFSPRMTHKGMEISASSLVDVGNKIIESETKVYSGKISSVVRQIADDIGIEAEIEETNDDANESILDNRGGPKQWLTKCNTPFEFIRKELQPYAISKSSQSQYQFWVTGGGTRSKGVVLHFHTKEYSNCSVRSKTLKKFTYLSGQTDQVIEFLPNYDSSLIGNIGGSQTVMRAYDPVTKQFVSSAQNTRNNSDTTAFGTGTKSVSSPITEEGPNDDLASQGGVHILREDTLEESLARARRRWELLKSFSFTAVLTLVGLPPVPGQPGSGTVDLEANDLIDITVLIPNSPGASGPSYQKHWSSGLYLVTEAVHQIEAGYTVTCQLRRDLSELGPAPKIGVDMQVVTG